MTRPPGVYLCCNCGNRTPHALLTSHAASQVFDQVGEDVMRERYEWRVYTCGTCDALSLQGAFVFSPNPDRGEPSPFQRLYPVGPRLNPPPHSVSPREPIPIEVVTAYEGAWPLRHLSPSAFANQVRRCLEFICRDQEARGAKLSDQLKDLASKGIFPEDLVHVADLLREVGNLGSHVGSREIDVWDAELVDELFRTVVQYVYVAPAQVRRMRERLSQ